jgi:hypothetical protein
MEIVLKPQEENTNSKFDGQIVMTRNFINVFGNKAFMIALQSVIKIQEERVPQGADYFQSLEYYNIPYWVIDDVDHVTVLMPEDY